MFKKKKILIWSSVLLAVVGLTLLLFSSSKTEDASKQALDRIYTVKKGDMVISLLLAGNVNAQKKYKLSHEAAVNTKLLSIIPENTKVKKGEILAKFETEELEMKIKELQTTLDGQQKELQIAQEARRILESTNAADIRSAKDAANEANNALDKYWKLEGPKAKGDQTQKVEDAKKAYENASAAYKTQAEKVNSTVYTKDTEEQKDKQTLSDLKQKMDQASVAYNGAMLDRKILKRYTNPSKLTELRNKLAQSKLNYERVQIETASKMIQKDSEISRIEANIRKTQYELDKNKSYLPIMQLEAPVDGFVTYSDPDQRWGKAEVKVGMDVRRKEVLITIPDMNNLIVDVGLPEQYRSKIKEGLKVIITPDSLPTLKLNGKIAKIDALPVNQIMWDPNSPKMYPSKIELVEQSSELVSGMSVQVEVVTDILKNVFSVPVEAVFEENGKYFVYLKTSGKPKSVPVEIGQSNESFVEIKSGLNEGDSVFLYKPFQSNKTD